MKLTEQLLSCLINFETLTLFPTETVIVGLEAVCSASEISHGERCLCRTEEW